ncbi:MAG: hypothetical protein ROR55_19965 [Devosia sp.]
MSIDVVYDAIVTKLKADLPDVDVVKALEAEVTVDSLKANSVRVPAVLVTPIGAKLAQIGPNGKVEIPFRWAVFCVAHANQPLRSALDLTAAVSVSLCNERFGPNYPAGPMVGLATIERIENFTSDESIKNLGHHIWGITVETNVLLGSEAWTEDSTNGGSFTEITIEKV